MYTYRLVCKGSQPAESLGHRCAYDLLQLSSGQAVHNLALIAPTLVEALQEMLKERSLADIELVQRYEHGRVPIAQGHFVQVDDRFMRRCLPSVANTRPSVLVVVNAKTHLVSGILKLPD